MAKLTRSARRAIQPLLDYLCEDMDHAVLERPVRGKGGHPMYRRLPTSQQKDMVRLMRWLLAQSSRSRKEEAELASKE